MGFNQGSYDISRDFFGNFMGIYEVSLEFQWWFYDISMRFLFGSCEVSMIFLWDF